MELIILMIILFILYIIYTTYPIYYILFNLNKNFYLKIRFQYTISAIIVGPIFGFLEFCLYIIEPKYEIKFVILFNFFYIIGNMSLIMYIYRGIIMYSITDKKKKIAKSIKFLFIFIYFLGIVFMVIIDFLLYNKIIFPNNFLLIYHYFIIVLCLIIHLKIIYELHQINNNIKYDYLCSFIFIILTNIFSYIYPDSIYSKYKITISTLLSYVPYIIIPLIVFFKNKNKDYENNHYSNFDNNIFDNCELKDKIKQELEKNNDIKNGEDKINNIYIELYNYKKNGLLSISNTPK